MRIRPRVATISSILLGAVSVAVLAFSLTINQTASAIVPGINQLASQSTGGTPANAISSVMNRSITSDGRYVVFSSTATNLTPESTGGVFIRDTISQTTTMVSLSDTGAPVSGNRGIISYDGRYVAFISSATNVVSGVTSGRHIYVRDRLNSTTKIVDTSPTGTPSVGGMDYLDMSADGRYFVFTTSDHALNGLGTGYTNSPQVVVKDIVGGKLRNLTGASSPSQSLGNVYPSIDCSGRVVTFISNNANLGAPYVGQGQTNVDVYVATVDWDTTALVRASNLGTMNTSIYGAPQVSCNGNHVLWASSSEPFNTYKYDRLTTNKSAVSLNTSGIISDQTYVGGARANVSAISDDGRYVVFTNKGTNMDSTKPQTYKSTTCDVFVRDTRSNTTNLVSFTALGNHSGRVGCYNSQTSLISISADGSTVAYSYKTDSGDSNSELISGTNTGQQDVYISKTGF